MNRTAADDSGTGGGALGATRVQHWMCFGLRAWLAVVAAGIFRLIWHGGQIIMQLVFLGAFVVIMLYASGAERKHARQLCLWCQDKLPVNPGAAAQRLDWALRLRHWREAKTGRRLLFVYGPAILLWWYSYLWPPLLTWSLFTVGAAVLIGGDWVTNQHTRFFPWCPYCRFDGGGTVTPVPDPVNAGDR